MNETNNDKVYTASTVSQEGAKQVVKVVPMGGYQDPTPGFTPPTGSNGMQSAPKFTTNEC